MRRYAASIPHLRLELREFPDDASQAVPSLDAALAANPAAMCVYLPDEFSGRWYAGAGPDAVEATRAWMEGPAARRTVVIAAGTDLGLPAVGHVGADFPQCAEALGRSLARLAAGRRSYSLLHQSGRSSTASRGRTRFLDVVQRAHELTLLEEREMPADPRAARRCATELLAKFSHTGLLVTLSPELWLAKPPDFTLGERYRFATIGAASALWPRLRSGEAAALIGPLDGEIGYSSARLAWETLTGAKPAGTRVTIPSELVTLDTLADFEQRYRLAADMKE